MNERDARKMDKLSNFLSEAEVKKSRNFFNIKLNGNTLLCQRLVYDLMAIQPLSNYSKCC